MQMSRLGYAPFLLEQTPFVPPLPKICSSPLQCSPPQVGAWKNPAPAPLQKWNFNCVNNGYGSQKFMINLITTICLYLKLHHVVSFSLFSKKYSKLWPECMAIATMTWSCPGVEQSSIQGGKLPSSSRSIKPGAMHLAPAPDVKE